MEVAQRNYEELKQSHGSSQQAIREAEARYRELQDKVEQRKSDEGCTLL